MADAVRALSLTHYAAQPARGSRVSRTSAQEDAARRCAQPYGRRVQEISRRSAMKAAAWSVPVIAVAAATPLAAASGPGALTNAIALMFGVGGQAILVQADTGGAAIDPRAEHFSVSGLPPARVLNVQSFSSRSLDVDLILDSTIVPAGRMLTINIPGFAPVTIPIAAG